MAAYLIETYAGGNLTFIVQDAPFDRFAGSEKITQGILGISGGVSYLAAGIFDDEAQAIAAATAKAPLANILLRRPGEGAAPYDFILAKKGTAARREILGA